MIQDPYLQNLTGKENPEDVIEHLYQHYSHELRSYLVGRGLSPEDSEECLHDALLKIHRVYNEPRIGFDTSNKAGFRGWMYTIVRNASIDKQRHNTGRNPGNRPEFIYYADAALSSSPDFTCMIVVQDAADAAITAINALPENTREAIIMHLQGVKYSTMQRQTGIPASTIRTRVKVGLRDIRNYLKEQGYDPELLFR
ncbi:MAG: RNA polymerase sigma factor [Candidatus Aenigmarchaeota archaeon]|nr:RNA polymerase sigma factor [Candidatus Aenigmarchaeota archaeon]